MNTSVAPAASLLKARADLLASLRAFLNQRGVLEVETPLLWPTAIPESCIELFVVQAGDRTAFLQPSPELFLKKLLAQGVGDLFQLSKVFRRGEAGRWHNPEFTLLEWYRVGWELEAFIAEVVELIRSVLGDASAFGSSRSDVPVDSFRYGDLFEEILDLPPQAPLDAFSEKARALGVPEAEKLCRSRSDWLDFLFATFIQPKLPEGIVVVKDYPAELSALARLKSEEIAARFEVFVSRIELANGYHELNDSHLLRKRLEAAREEKRRRGEVVPPLDEEFLRLTDRLPDCCGVALGVDRLLALKLGRDSIREVMTFPWPLEPSL